MHHAVFSHTCHIQGLSCHIIIQKRTFSSSNISEWANKSDWAASWSSFQSLALGACRFISRFPLKVTQFADLYGLSIDFCYRICGFCFSKFSGAVIPTWVLETWQGHCASSPLCILTAPGYNNSVWKRESRDCRKWSGHCMDSVSLVFCTPEDPLARKEKRGACSFHGVP